MDLEDRKALHRAKIDRALCSVMVRVWAGHQGIPGACEDVGADLSLTPNDVTHLMARALAIQEYERESVTA